MFKKVLFLILASCMAFGQQGSQLGNGNAGGNLPANTAFTGPSPWIDLSAYGGVGDAQWNQNGSVTGGVATLTVSGNAAFVAADVGKYIGMAAVPGTTGPGLAKPAAPTLAAAATGSLFTTTYVVCVTAIGDNGTVMTTESICSNEVSQAVTSGQRVNITLAALGTGQTGWRVYTADTTLQEVLQIPGSAGFTCTQTGRNVQNNACDGSQTAALLINNYTGPTPPLSSTWFTKISAFSSGTSVTLQDAPPTTSSSMRLGWGTDNQAALTAATAACPLQGASGFGNGCIIFLPPITGASRNTGRYFFLNGAVITSSNIVITGGGSRGTTSNNAFGSGWWTGNRNSTEIVTLQRVWGLSFDNESASLEGGGAEDIGIEDFTGEAYGGLFHGQVNSTGGTLDHMKFRDMSILSFLAGPCVGLSLVQVDEFWGVQGECRMGIRGYDNVSASEFHGGQFVGPTNGAPIAICGTAGSTICLSYGAWFSNNPQTATGFGNVRMWAIQFRDYVSGCVRYSDVPTSEVYGLKCENIALSGGASCGGNTACYGTGFTADSPGTALGVTGRCTKVGWWGGHITKNTTLFNWASGCDSLDIIEPSFSNISNAAFYVNNSTNGDIRLGNTGATNGSPEIVSSLAQNNNTARVAADFTTAANTNLQTITGLSFALPNGVATKFSFKCELTYSQATAAAAVAFGIQAATNAPTAINANGVEGTSLTAFTTGTLRGLATTTATAIVSATPSAVGALGTAADMFNVFLSGTVENPQQANTLNFMVSTATAADAVTVYRGSYCQLY